MIDEDKMNVEQHDAAHVLANEIMAVCFEHMRSRNVLPEAVFHAISANSVAWSALLQQHGAGPDQIMLLQYQAISCATPLINFLDKHNDEVEACHVSVAGKALTMPRGEA